MHMVATENSKIYEELLGVLLFGVVVSLVSLSLGINNGAALFSSRILVRMGHLPSHSNHASPMMRRLFATIISLVTFALLRNSNTVDAFGFGPRRHVMWRAHSSLQKSNLAAAATSSSSSSSSVAPPFRLQHIDHVVIRCKNFPSMFDFYHRILGCTIDEPKNEHVNRFGGALTHLRAGSCYIDLLAYDTNHLSEEGVVAAARMHAGGVGLGDDKSLEDVNLSSESSTLDHLCLRIDPFDEEALLKYLEGENADIVAVGNRLGADGVGPSVYVRDPEGNVIELKGSPINVNSQADSEIDKAKNNMQRMDSAEISDVADNSVLKGGEAGDENETLQSSSDAHTESSPAQSTTKDNTPPTVPLTPCNRICRYNSSFYDGQVCIGCFREAYEIEMWQSMTPAQKSMTLLDTMDRCSENQQVGGDTFDGAIAFEELTRQYEYWSERAKI